MLQECMVYKAVCIRHLQIWLACSTYCIWGLMWQVDWRCMHGAAQQVAIGSPVSTKQLPCNVQPAAQCS